MRLIFLLGLASVSIVLAAPAAHAQEAEGAPIDWEEAPGPVGEPVTELGEAPPPAQAEAPPAAPAAPAPAAPCPVGSEEPLIETVEVEIHGTMQGVRYELIPVRSSAYTGDDPRYHAPDFSEPTASCDGACRVVVPAGRYRLRTIGRRGLGVYPGERELTLDTDAELSVTPPSAARRSAGLRAAIIGTVLAPVGLLTLMVGVSIEEEEDMECSSTYDSYASCENERVNGAVYAGAIMGVVGAVMIPVGWATFGKNRHPRVRMTRAVSSGDGATEARLQIGPRRLASGYGLGLRYAF